MKWYGFERALTWQGICEKNVAQYPVCFTNDIYFCIKMPKQGIYEKNASTEPHFYLKRGTGSEFFCIYPARGFLQIIYLPICRRRGTGEEFFCIYPARSVLLIIFSSNLSQAGYRRWIFPYISYRTPFLAVLPKVSNGQDWKSLCHFIVKSVSNNH